MAHSVMPSSSATHRWRGKLILISLLLIAASPVFLLIPGCAVTVAEQKVPEHVLRANAADFVVADDVTALHYYGVGGWGVKWRGQYLLLAPYFSNHGFLGLFGKNGPDLEAVNKGVINTPFTSAGLILVGHGHVDHAADIPAYPAAGLPGKQAGVIANETTLNMLAELMPPNAIFRCAEAPHDNALPVAGCTLSGFRITPLRSNHAPNVKILGKGFTIADGIVSEPQIHVPERPADYQLGMTWAYLIDLLDEYGEVVFRIHYVDAVAGGDQSSIPAELAAQRDVDIHIACVPGFAYVKDYPEWALDQGKAGYVLLGHWEDFFQSRDKRLKPVTWVLSEKKLNQFVQRIEAGMSKDAHHVAPLNKSDENCPAGAERCGPRGESWAMPVPGETYQFRTHAGP
jgi:hypothetical protein